MAFLSQFIVNCATYCALCCEVAKQHIIAATIIFNFHNNSFLINDSTLLKVVAFNVALFHVALFKLELFDAALFDVELFQYFII